MVRKTVTVVFADLVGSTSLGERADPEVLQGVMQRYHGQLRSILERHGGTVEKFIGDAAMAVFGIPQAHEDDALRAVRAATEIREAVAGLGLEVRIGVNTGEVVTGNGETLVTGDTVNVAARLEQAAEAGEILIGAGTERLLGAGVSVEPVAALALKGKAKPVSAFRLRGVAPDVPAFTRVIGVPFVGREQELQVLESAFAAIVEQRQPRLATIVGPPGIGKSRLAHELIARSQAQVLIGRCPSYGEGITYWPMREVVQQVGDVKRIVDDETIVRRLDAAIAGGDATADEIALAFRKMFEALARVQPLIVVLDDIHWAEPTLLDLIEYVSAFTADVPLLLLCIARPDLYELRPSWSSPRANVVVVTLAPLAQEHAEALVDELRELREETKAQIVEAAEGNPLFVEQLVAHQADTDKSTLEIPPTIHALLAARIDRLEPSERAVIECASVEGRLFHRGAIQALLPERERAAVGSHLLALVRKEFVRPDRAELPDDDGFRFGHILIRDAAYDSIPKRVRAELHERFAAWLGERMGEEAATEILGYHLEQAYRYRTELGAPDEALARRAGRLLADAGGKAYRRLDMTAACSLLSRAAELLPSNEPQRASSLLSLGHALFENGEVALALETLRNARRTAAAAGQRSIELRARMRELGCLATSSPTADMREALAEARAAISEFEAADDPHGLLDAWWSVAQAALALGDMPRREEAAAESLVLARRLGLRREAGEAARSLGFALANGPTPVEEAVPRVEEAFAEVPEEPAVPLALLYAMAGRHGDAERVMEKARSEQLQLGKRLQHAADSMDLAEAALLAGRPEWAEPALRAGAAVLETAGERGWFGTVGALLGETLYRLGRYDEAEMWAVRSYEAEPESNVLSCSVRAKIWARRGNAERALSLADEAFEALSELAAEIPIWRGDCLFDRAEVLRMLGRPDEARTFFKRALEVYDGKGIVPSIERTKQAIVELDDRDLPDGTANQRISIS